MRVKNNCLKLLLSGVGALLLECTLHAEIIVLSTPSSGFGEMSLGIGSPKVWRDDAKSPNYVAKVALPAVDYTGPYSGRADASNYSVSGSISCTDNPSQRGSSSAGDTVNLYADVVPSSNIRVKFQSNLSVNWVGTNLNTGAGFSFSAIGTEDKGSAISRQPTSVSPLSENKSWAVAVKAAATSDYAPGGKPYYKLGTFSVTGGAEIFNPNTNAGYSSKVTDVKAYYIGNALAYNDGGNQTWVVGKELPKSLSVKVADGETGTLTSSGIPITFSLVNPVNGAKFSNGQTSIVTNTNAGIAAVKLTLGTSGGAYSVKAACPADKCTSGVKEVTFTETAKTREEVTKLTEMFCDGAHFYGQKLSDPLRVKALNLYTNKGEAELAVTFRTKAGSPLGIIHTENTTTGPDGLAGTDFTLSNELKTHTVVAHCAQCLAGTTVECLVRSMFPPNTNHMNPKVGLNKRKRGVNISVSPGEVYPQGAGSSLTTSIVTISGASPSTAFTAQVVAGANTGGHQHHDPNRPRGTLSGEGGTACTGSSPYACTTSASGSAQLKYVSSAVSGWDTILVKMATGEEGDAIVKVRVPDFIALPLPNANYYKDSNDGHHPNHYYGKQELINGINQIATEYMRQYNAQISVNDMSLINGGIFDVNSNWVPKPHVCHKEGMSVDFNRKHRVGKRNFIVINMGRRLAAISAQSGASCRRIVEKMVKGKCFVHFECPSSSTCQGEPGVSCQEICPKELPPDMICAEE